MLFMNLPYGLHPTLTDSLCLDHLPGDVVVAAGAKSGTTWMLFCTHQLRVKGKDVDFGDISFSTPWPDVIQKHSHTWEDTKRGYQFKVLSNGRRLKDYWDNPSYPFRIFKSHYMPMFDEGANI